MIVGMSFNNLNFFISLSFYIRLSIILLGQPYK
nr:MAG TPA: hypothetical protein [Caudoviricetes sp.]